MLLLQDLYPTPSNGTGTSINPGLFEGCTYRGSLISTLALAFKLEEFEAPVEVLGVISIVHVVESASNCYESGTKCYRRREIEGRKKTKNQSRFTNENSVTSKRN